MHHLITLIMTMKKNTSSPIDSMIHNFLNVKKIMDYENTIYSIASSQNFHPLGLLKINIQRN
jgi:hypothetical protein